MLLLETIIQTLLATQLVLDIELYFREVDHLVYVVEPLHHANILINVVRVIIGFIHLGSHGIGHLIVLEPKFLLSRLTENESVLVFPPPPLG